MKKVNYFPAILLVGLAAAGFGTWNVSLGQDQEEDLIIELDDEDLIPQESVEPVEPVNEPAESAPTPPAQPATPPADAIDANQVEQRLQRVEAQTKELMVNQKKIDDALIKIAEDIRQARIFASRSGGGAAPE